MQNLSCKAKKINVLFPETSQYLLGSYVVQIFFFIYSKSMKIIKNTLKIEEKFSDVPKSFRVGPKNVGSVGFLEMRHCLGRPNHDFMCMLIIMVYSIQQNYE